MVYRNCYLFTLTLWLPMASEMWQGIRVKLWPHGNLSLFRMWTLLCNEKLASVLKDEARGSVALTGSFNVCQSACTKGKVILHSHSPTDSAQSETTAQWNSSITSQSNCFLDCQVSTWSTTEQKLSDTQHIIWNSTAWHIPNLSVASIGHFNDSTYIYEYVI